jgi:hypothetical protein
MLVAVALVATTAGVLVQDDDRATSGPGEGLFPDRHRPFS